MRRKLSGNQFLKKKVEREKTNKINAVKRVNEHGFM